MTRNTFRTAEKAGFIVCAAFMAALTGCMTEGSNSARSYRVRPAVQIQTTVVVQDDYDYFPGYEVYYSRNRREYVYREGRSWVRRSEPRGVTMEVLLASPSVRLDFHDAPSRHHRRVVRTYPRQWAPPERSRDDREDLQEDRRDARGNDREEGRKHDGRADDTRN